MAKWTNCSPTGRRVSPAYGGVELSLSFSATTASKQTYNRVFSCSRSDGHGRGLPLACWTTLNRFPFEGMDDHATPNPDLRVTSDGGSRSTIPAGSSRTFDRITGRPQVGSSLRASR